MLDDNNAMDQDDNAEVEDEAERLLREQRAEKAKWLKANSHLMEEEDEEEEIDSQKLFLEDSQVFRLGKSTLKKIQSSCSFVLDSSTNSNSCSQFVGISSTSGISLERLNSCTGDSQNSLSGGSKSKLSSRSMFASPDDPLLKVRP